MHQGVELTDAQTIDEQYLLDLDKQKARDHMAEEEWYEALALWKRIAFQVHTSQEQDEAKQAIVKCREQIAKQPKEEGSTGEMEFKLDFKKPSTTLKDIVGMRKVKESVKKFIELPLLDMDRFRHFDLTASAGILLYGPPGTGKTAIVKAIAGQYSLPMYDVSVGDILSKWVGIAEQRLKELFRLARIKQPCILFFDEVDAIAKSRDSARGDQSGELQSTITELLKLMSDMHDDKESQVFIFGATNQPWNVDTASKRSGRFSFHFYIGAPIFTERMGLFQHLIKKEVRGRLSWFKLALATTDYTGADIEKVISVAKLNAMATKGKVTLNTHDIQKVLKDRDMGKSTLDEYFEITRSEYMGERRRKITKRILWLIPVKWEWEGKEGKWSRADRKVYKDMVKDLKRHFANWPAIRLARWIGRNI